MLKKPSHIALGVVLLAISSSASAIGLGELNESAVLGESLNLTVDIVGAEEKLPDASCFRLVKPRSGDDLPWLREAHFSIRSAGAPLLEIRSPQVLREPIIQMAIQMACGYEIHREYTLLVSPPTGNALLAEPSVPRTAPLGRASPDAVARRNEPVARAAPRALPASPALSQTMLSQRMPKAEGSSAAESALRLSTALTQNQALGQEISEAQREILRLESRVQATLQEQAALQLAEAERLRQATGQAGQIAGVPDAVSVNASETPVTPPASAPALASKTPEKPPITAPVHAPEPDFLSGSGLYGLLAGFVLGLLIWLLRQRRRAPESHGSPVEDSADVLTLPPRLAVPARAVTHDSLGLSLAPANVKVAPAKNTDSAGHAAVAPAAAPFSNFSASPGDAIVDEQFAANPVMELADIMLSFGRVKGAAQALQEYVDNNPREALQPWLRLLDVYRVANMREEFERVAADLNKYFNVEVQAWETLTDGAAVDFVLDSGEPLAQDSHAQVKLRSLEDLPHIIHRIVDLWDSGDVVGYLYQLLRDNRGGQRQGFSIFVAAEILFLIELKETANRMAQ